MPEAGKRTYLLEMNNGTRKKVTVPDAWRVTFGPLVPGSKDGSVNSRQAICLRFYEGADAGKGKQHAVFTNVESFRVLDEISIEEERIESREETLVRQGDESGEQVVVRAEAKTWVNPDAPKQQTSAFGEKRSERSGAGLVLIEQRK